MNKDAATSMNIKDLENMNTAALAEYMDDPRMRHIHAKYTEKLLRVRCVDESYRKWIDDYGIELLDMIVSLNFKEIEEDYPEIAEVMSKKEDFYNEVLKHLQECEHCQILSDYSAEVENMLEVISKELRSAKVGSAGNQHHTQHDGQGLAVKMKKEETAH